MLPDAGLRCVAGYGTRLRLSNALEKKHSHPRWCSDPDSCAGGRLGARKQNLRCRLSRNDPVKKKSARDADIEGGCARLFRAAKKSLFQVSFFAARSPRPLMSAPGQKSYTLFSGEEVSRGVPGGGQGEGAQKAVRGRRSAMNRTDAT